MQNSTKWPVVSDNQWVQVFYEDMREAGQSHVMADMLAHQRAPGCETDSTLFAGTKTLAEQFKHDPHHLDLLIKKAKARGISVNATDQYEPCLASEPLDPSALIPHSGGRSHVKKLCEAKGIDCNGRIKVKGNRLDKEPEMCKLAPNLVEESVNKMIQRDPGLASKDRRELRAKVIHEQGNHKQAAPKKPKG